MTIYVEPDDSCEWKTGDVDHPTWIGFGYDSVKCEPLVVVWRHHVPYILNHQEVAYIVAAMLNVQRLHFGDDETIALPSWFIPLEEHDS